MRLTTKQSLLIRTLIKSCFWDEDGQMVGIDLDSLLEDLAYKTTKQSLQFSIRALIKKGLIEKSEPELRRGRIRAVLIPTKTAMQVFNQKSLERPRYEQKITDGVIEEFLAHPGV